VVVIVVGVVGGIEETCVSVSSPCCIGNLTFIRGFDVCCSGIVVLFVSIPIIVDDIEVDCCCCDSVGGGNCSVENVYKYVNTFFFIIIPNI
jgi:hypothetical protein